MLELMKLEAAVYEAIESIKKMPADTFNRLPSIAKRLEEMAKGVEQIKSQIASL